ncbi:hypothetical protein vseg_001345 [Gypsophila vaccaria]
MTMYRKLASCYKSFIFLSIYLCIYLFCSGIALEVSYDARALKFDGTRKLIISGSIHYPRSTPEMWPDLIRKAKQGGLNTIESYVFWNAHEPLYRQYNFTGNLDFVRFFKTIQNEGLYAILRIGPYVCAEWNYGGFPMWLHNMPGIQLRTNNQIYMDEMQTFTTLIVNMARQANLFASQGGPIILAQIENEYGNVYAKYGKDGKEYIKWAAQMAVQQNISVPWIMCQQSDAPSPMINTCNGYYCDDFKPNRGGVPKMFTENWSGWYKQWGQSNPHRRVEDLAYSTARFFQKGGALMNYYMYHGGTNFGRTAGAYMSTSYDYDAPLDEFGNINHPKYGHLKELHGTIMSLERIIVDGVVDTTSFSPTLEVTVFTLEGSTVCFIGNTDGTKDATFDFKGVTYTIPAWSVSILPNCTKATYNTAEVYVDAPEKAYIGLPPPLSKPLEWWWTSEDFTHLSDPEHAPGVITANKLIDQKEVANDTSDYLFYMTSVMVNDGDPLLGEDVVLQVNSSGPVLHAFVNSEYCGTSYGSPPNFKFTFGTPIKLVKGLNRIALLSVTVGFVNYGPFFDLVPTGVTGPVKLVALNTSGVIKTEDLSSNQWIYKVGLVGEQKKFYSSNMTDLPWQPQKIVHSRKFTWFMTNFSTPVGDGSIVLDFKRLGKGHAWVNGNSIGRYWTNYLANNDCDKKCDYRGKYSPHRCNTDCGSPTQRWYHVPRSFLSSNGNNTLILFEEFGGDPSVVIPMTLDQRQDCVKRHIC